MKTYKYLHWEVSLWLTTRVESGILVGFIHDHVNLAFPWHSRPADKFPNWYIVTWNVSLENQFSSISPLKVLWGANSVIWTNHEQNTRSKSEERPKYFYLVNKDWFSVFLPFLAATTIVEAGKDKKNPDDFAEALDSVLGDFAFPDVFLFDVWGAIGDVKNGRI